MIIHDKYYITEGNGGSVDGNKKYVTYVKYSKLFISVVEMLMNGLNNRKGNGINIYMCVCVCVHNCHMWNPVSPHSPTLLPG